MQDGGAAGADDSPVADVRATVVSGRARFTVLTDRLVRMEYAGDGAFEDRASIVFVNRLLPVPKFAVSRTGDGCVIDTGALKLTYRGGPFAADTLQVEGRGAVPFRWRFGDRDRGNLYGTTRTLDKVGDLAQMMERMEKGLVSRDGWTVVDDSDGLLFEPRDDHWGQWPAPRPAGERRDLYLFGYGHAYKDALGDYVKVAGRIPLPPRFAFGYWWCRYWPYSDYEIEALVDRFEGFGIPLDVMVIDMDWHKTFGLGRNTVSDEFDQLVGWTGYTWERGLFPHPEKFLEQLHRRGLKVAMNLHPAGGIAPREDCYERFRAAYGWAGTNAIPYRLSEPKWADCWYDEVLRPLERQGVDFWWLDWQQWLTSKDLPGLSNTFWLNHTMARHESEKTDAEGRPQRPLVYHRWGGLGSHRYQMGFSGDTFMEWTMLAAIPWFTATSGNVGYGYWGHDIGGHMDIQNFGHEPEIFLRWLQGGVFTPLFRTHSTCFAPIERRIWMFPEHFDAMRETFRLRYRLAPYVYTAARAAYDTGVSICRPMYWDDPEADEAYSPLLPQLRFGPDIVAVTVAEHTNPTSGLAKASFWLPPGRWFDMSAGELLDGGRRYNRAYAIDENPWLVKAGAMLPMNPPEVRNLQTADGAALELWVAPGAAEGAGELYEDDGRSADYATRFARTRFAFKAEATKLVLDIAPRVGDYPGMPSRRRWTVRLLGRLPPVAVTANGKPVAWSYDGLQGDVCATVADCDPSKPCRVAFAFDRPVEAGERTVAGLRRFNRRVRALGEPFKAEIEAATPMAMPPAEWLALASLPSRLSAEPERAAEMLLRLPQDLAAFAVVLNEMKSALAARFDAWLFRPNAATPMVGGVTPCGLKVDGTDGSAVRLSPVFSWHYAATRPGASQTGYRLRVLEGDRTVWDSHTVYTESTVGVRYLGPTLESGRTYAWELALTDENGAVGPSARGSFRPVADAPARVPPGDDERGFGFIKRVWRIWRDTDDVTVVEDNWPELCAAPVLADDVATYAEGIRQIRAGWLMKEMGRALEGEVTSRKYQAIEKRARKQVAALGQTPAGGLREELQTADNLILAFQARLFPNEAVKRAMAARLAELIRANGLPAAGGRFEPEETLGALTGEAGLGELVWSLVLRGAADGYDVPGWRVAYGAGIRGYWTRAGYRVFALEPCVSGDVDGVSETFASSAGPIASAWSWADGGTWRWEVEVPAGALAKAVLPDGQKREFGGGRHVVTLPLPRQMKFENKEK